MNPYRTWPAISIMTLALIATACHSTSTHDDTEDRTTQERTLMLPQGFRYPNGIAIDQTGTLFVGSAETGTILQRSPRSDWQTLRQGRDAQVFAGTSLRLDEDRQVLWGCSPDFAPSRPAGEEPRSHRIFRLDARSGEVLSSIPIPDKGFGNDLALASDGGVYLTDTLKPRLLYVAPDGVTVTTVAEDARFEPVNGIGLAGIAVLEEGLVAVGHFGAGRLFIINPQTGQVQEPNLPRRLANPDGMWALSNNRLLITEGDVATGNGRLTLAENLFADEVKLTEMASGLDGPVNLTVQEDMVFVTECRIRHLMNPDAGLPTPEKFWVRQIRIRDFLPASNNTLN